ncbi:MAG: hypothetical protein GWP67_08250 [Gammaproteobacteria bacterium]|jgi:hypothetical protein|nr:hypothetical protein [Gammaproteobacteria bacterium]
MKNIGYFLVAAGFLGGAFATSLDVQNVNWTLYTGMAGAAIIGLIIYKRQVGALARSEEVLELNRVELRESIANVVHDLDEIVGDGLTQGAVLRDRIDLKLREDLRRFADARESMVHLFGLQTYADIMSNFAAGERYINRVWSASADGYDEEANVYLKKAAAQFVLAKEQLVKAAEAIV